MGPLGTIALVLLILAWAIAGTYCLGRCIYSAAKRRFDSWRSRRKATPAIAHPHVELEGILDSVEPALAEDGPLIVRYDGRPWEPPSEEHDIPPIADRADERDHFIVVDVETTGLDPTLHKIIEIGAIKVRHDGTEVSAFSALIDHDIPIPRRITEITGITRRELTKSGRNYHQVMSELMRFIATYPLVAYNAPFDLRFLRAASKETSNGRIDNPVLDALPMARAAFPGLPNHKLGTVADHLGIDSSNAHRAIHDCRMTKEIFITATRINEGS